MVEDESSHVFEVEEPALVTTMDIATQLKQI